MQITFFDQKENQIGVGNMEHAPRVGESIWMLCGGGDQKAYSVTDVAHWVSVVSEYHKCAVYLKKIR